MSRMDTVVWIAVLALATAALGDAADFIHDVLPILQQHCQTCHRPGEPSVVPHVSHGVRPRGSSWMKGAKRFVPYVPAVEEEPSGATLTAYSPGMQPGPFDIDHSAKLIPAGSDIVLQLHFTANGK